MIFSLVSVSVQAEENTAATDSAVIYSIYVTIKEPAVGDTPATTGTMREGASTYITGISWDGDFDENGCFKAGGSYTVTVGVAINPGLNKTIDN